MNPVEEDRALAEEEDGRFGLSEARGREAMDPATRRLAMIAGGIGLLLAVLIGGWVFGGRQAGGIPVIEAPYGPVRLKPADAGGMQALGAQAPPPVNSSGAEALAPGPEAPRPEALQAEVDAARRASGLAVAPSAAAPAAPPGTRADKPAPLSPAAPEQPPDPGKLRTEATPDASQPAERAVPGHGPIAIQLAALDSHDAAQAERKRLADHYPDLFNPAPGDGKSFEVLRAEHDGHPIYRLRMLGFGSQAAAAAFCRRARAQDVACAVADF
ncbi:SPOR domain-containing protein [Lichenicoccus sp.]|uniref:SPOR domain-containing protein n=1 Tax=Lichenicoccus sp. TaxID=2781899 RepID=UPI003D0EEB24